MESHKSASMLELLYDLVAVIAISIASNGLHHSIVHQQSTYGFITFITVFFAIWWSWMNFTWFGSSNNKDDTIHHILVFMQMVGSIIFSACINNVFENMDFRISWVGFLIMRISLIAMWLRLYASSPENRSQSIKTILGISFCQVGWFVLAYYIPKYLFLPIFAILVCCELLVPFLAKRKEKVLWHPEHIIERYSLLTIIVIGECLLSSVKCFQLLVENQQYASLLPVFFSNLTITFSIWWLYFLENKHNAIKDKTAVFQWGYGHLFVFSSIAILGASLSSVITNTGNYKFVSISLMLFLFGLWIIHDLPKKLSLREKLELPIAILLLLCLSYFFNSLYITSFFILLLSVYRTNNIF